MVSIATDDVDDVDAVEQDTQGSQLSNEQDKVHDDVDNNSESVYVDDGVFNTDTQTIVSFNDQDDVNGNEKVSEQLESEVVNTESEEKVEPSDNDNDITDSNDMQQDSETSETDESQDTDSKVDSDVIAAIDAEKDKLEKELAEAKLSGSAGVQSSAKKSAIALVAGLSTLVAASLAGVYYFRSVHRDNYAKFCKRVTDANKILEENHKIHLKEDYRTVSFEMDNSETKGLLMQFKNQLITREVLITKLRQCHASVKLFYVDGSDAVHIPFQLVDSIANYNVINNIAQYVLDVGDSLLQKTDNGLMLPDLLGRLDVLRGMTDADALKKYFQQHTQVAVSPLDVEDKQQCKSYRQLYVMLQSIPSLYYLYIIAPEVFRSTQKATEDNVAASFVSSMIKMLGVQLLQIVKKYAY